MTPWQREGLEATAKGEAWRIGPAFNPITTLAQIVIELADQQRSIMFPLTGNTCTGNTVSESTSLDIGAIATAELSHTPVLAVEPEQQRVRHELQDIVRSWTKQYGSLRSQGPACALVDRMLDRLMEAAPEGGYGWLVSFLQDVKNGAL